MSTGDPYVYCPSTTVPDGPYDNGPETSPCGTKDSVTAIWPAVKKWKMDIINCTFQLNGYVYNATQRGTYYYQFDGSGTMNAASESPCATGHDDRVFGCNDCIRGTYKYIPCCEESVCNGPPPGSQYGGGFYRQRQALDYLNFDITMNDWVVDPIGQTNSQISPNIYWDVPDVRIGGMGDPTNPGGNTENPTSIPGYPSNVQGGAVVNFYEMQPNLSLYSCFNTPVEGNTEYGCTGYYLDNGVARGGGYDCFGKAGDGNFRGEVINGGKGYWQLQGNVWNYTTDWYWVNTHGTWKCGKCTYCKGTKGGCEDCTPCTGDGHNCNGDPMCTCSSCEGYDCGDGSRSSGYCYPQACDYHDLWQKGHFNLTLTPGANDPTRCTS